MYFSSSETLISACSVSPAPCEASLPSSREALSLGSGGRWMHQEDGCVHPLDISMMDTSFGHIHNGCMHNKGAVEAGAQPRWPKSRSVKRGPDYYFFHQRCMFSFSTGLHCIIITKMSTKLIKDVSIATPPFPKTHGNPKATEFSSFSSFSRTPPPRCRSSGRPPPAAGTVLLRMWMCAARASA